MDEDCLLRSAGLDLFARQWKDEGLPFSLAVEKVQTIVGHSGQVGSWRRPLPSSAARMTVGDHSIWIPCPTDPGNPACGEAALYEVGGRTCVLPTIRLVEPKGLVRYLCLSDWLLDAFTVWQFSVISRGGASDRCTVLPRLREKLSSLTADKAAGVVAQVVRLALVGFRSVDKYRSALGRIGLRVPCRMPSWLRSVEGNSELARTVARRQVVTATIEKKGKRAGLPQLTQCAEHRIDPFADHDRGIDPVHTPEGENTRFVGYLGTSVGVDRRRLVIGESEPLPLSPSTAQIPFARYDVPRRLLIASKMQTQAIPLADEEKPLVRVGTAPCPPGVNLRVGYLAWKGLNHEDAWVLSESAARKLAAAVTEVQAVHVHAVEAAPILAVKEGDAVEKDSVLCRRGVSPLLLAPELSQLVKLNLTVEQLERFELKADRTVRSSFQGKIEKIEDWNLASGMVQGHDWIVPEGVRGRWRRVLRFHIRRELPLEAGDKLANRHGHKGVVGRILPDDEMPRWRGRPLEVLIDPISVLNRSNWGQVYETLLGRLLSEGGLRAGMDHQISKEKLLEELRGAGHDEAGRGVIEPPQSGDWQHGSCRGVVGVQYVMRLPKHAAEILSADLPRTIRRPGTRIKESRLGEQVTWAAWAQGIGLEPIGSIRPFAGAADLEALLEAAGIGLEHLSDDGSVCLRWLPLDCQPPSESTHQVKVAKKVEDNLRHVREMGKGGRSVLLLNCCISAVWRPGLTGRSGGGAGCAQPNELACVRWLRIPPPAVRKATRGFDGAEYKHELTTALEKVIQCAVYRARGKPHRGNASDEELERKLRVAVQRFMQAAYRYALGTSHKGCKEALLGQRVFRPKLPHSGRAVIVPAGLRDGQMELGLDEVGLPEVIYRAVFPEVASSSDLVLRTFGLEQPWVWVKRDPVLHRWGLLRMRARCISGNAIQMPASLLEPMGADFDGDAVTVFRAIPGEGGQTDPVLPSAMAWDEVRDQPVFLPGKQYIYGLHLLQKDSRQQDDLNVALKTLNAPSWPVGLPAQKALQKWVAEAAKSLDPRPGGKWWSIVEQYALTALRENPAMDLGLLPAEDLAKLDVIEAGAAKKKLFERFEQGSEEFAAYNGESLDVFRTRGGNGPKDTIATVMAVAAASKGKFGNLPRRFIYAAQALNGDDFRDFVRNVQYLSEQAMQLVLSVKAGDSPLDYVLFRKHVLKPILNGQEPDYENLSGPIKEFLDMPNMQQVCRQICTRIDPHPKPWLRWLIRPSRLAGILAEEGGRIELPMSDPRMRPFVCAAPGRENQGGIGHSQSGPDHSSD